jgi:ubiquinone biosynthesis protein COQ9
MLNEMTVQGRIVAAAMRLAGTRPWDEVTMRDIADASGIGLVEMRREFPSKSAIIASFIRSTDDAVLAKAPRPSSEQAPRDRIFDVVMSRLDVLAPYKPALKSIAASRVMDSTILKKSWASQAWMLHAAGIGTDGPLGSVRVMGLGTVYGSVMQTWLDDTDPGLGRTMAALDRRLKRGEEVMRSANGVVEGVTSVFDRVMGRVGKRASETTQPPAGSSQPS